MTTKGQEASAGRLIDITDLRQPVLSDIQKQVISACEQQPVTFDPEAILAKAQEVAGLSDFGADDFRPRLEVWCRALESDSNASAVRRLDLYTMTLRYAVTRLRLEDYVKRHPEALDIEIDRPIIVAGLPRSGTTHLLGLLSADSRFRSLPWWEAIAPIPTPEDAPTDSDPNPRRTRAAKGWEMAEAVLPYMAIMHEFSPDHISEDIELQALDFSSYLIEWLARVPEWRDFYLGTDQTGPYAYLKRAMQVLSHIRGPNRWVIKCPQHMEQLPALYRTFPDATFVLTHRDPVGSVRSQMTMSAYAGRIGRKKVDVNEVLSYWPDRYERLLRRCVADRDILPEAQTIDVYFTEWIRNPDPILKRIYAMADMPLTDAALAELHAYLDEHGEQKKGKMIYNLERDFGITAAELRARYGFYFERFPDVKAEVS